MSQLRTQESGRKCNKEQVLRSLQSITTADESLMGLPAVRAHGASVQLRAPSVIKTLSHSGRASCSPMVVNSLSLLGFPAVPPVGSPDQLTSPSSLGVCSLELQRLGVLATCSIKGMTEPSNKVIICTSCNNFVPYSGCIIPLTDLKSLFKMRLTS